MPVDEPGFPANPFGLYHVHGNVWERVEDYWHDDYIGAPSDGRPWIEDAYPSRVLRGGSWISDPRNLRSTNRVRSAPCVRVNYTGFRVARMLAP